MEEETEKTDDMPEGGMEDKEGEGEIMTMTVVVTVAADGSVSWSHLTPNPTA